VGPRGDSPFRQRYLACAALLCSVSLTTPAAAPAESERSWLTRDHYPIEVSVSFTASLFHWLDSLTGLQEAGMSAGKTAEVHRRTYARLFGKPRDTDLELLRRFGEIRLRFARDSRAARAGGLGGDASRLLVAFFDAPDLEAALRSTAPLLTEDEYRDLGRILAHFAPLHLRVWNDGEIPRRFLDRCRDDRRLPELERLLAAIARFFDVDPGAGEPPHLVLTPVERGGGTHAQANGRHLLIELRKRDGLTVTAPVIVHENAHLMIHRIDPQRLERLESVAASLGPTAMQAVSDLSEALPTALGQGVAAQRFLTESFRLDGPWYHRPEIDAYAKRIYPTVKTALLSGGRFDEPLLRKLIALHPAAGEPETSE
jgi:hypothetical protein